MTFLTNKPIEEFKEVACRISGYTFNEVNQLDIPKQVVIDISPAYPTRTLQQMIKFFGCQYIESPTEMNANNVVYVIQEGQHNIIKIEVL